MFLKCEISGLCTSFSEIKMGVKNLWDILESCKKTLPLHHLQNKRVCIDLSCWIVQLQNVCKSHSTIKDKVYLRSLFHRLRALLALNCSLIFVTDGSIPAIKLSTYRRRLGSGSEVVRDETISQKVSSLPRNMGSEFSCMIKEAKVLGMALGIPCLDGIEEAEAQCALLNSESLCDGCFTADSDIFLFGAKRIYRDIDLGEGGHVVCYEMVDIERKLGFGRNSLIALALLLGSDYSHGVHGLGQETACQLVKSIGDQVVLQRVASEGLAFAKKTKRTKKQGKVLTGDASKENCLDYAQRVNVNEKEPIEEDQFLQVINAYLKPKCHSPDSEAVHRALVYHPLQRTRLQQLCKQFFGWTPDKTDEYIIPKIAERDLRRFANLRSSSASVGLNLPLYEIPVTCPVSSIIKPRKVQGRDYFEVSWKDDVGLKSSIVPADLIESACPEKIIEFMEGKAQGKKEKKNVRTRAKKADKNATVSEVELKIQSLVFDIESEHNVASTTALCSAPVIRDCSTMPQVIDLLNDRTRAKKTDKKAAVSEVDLKLQSLVLIIESEHNVASTTALCSAPVIRDCSTMPQVIDLLSPSPPIRACKISKFQHTIDRQIDVIDLSDSETDVSPEHARRAKELRSFIASID